MYILRGRGGDLQLAIERIDFGRLKLLQWPPSERGHNMGAHELAVARQRAAADRLLAAPRCPGSKPLLDPLTERDLGRIDVRAVVTAREQSAKLLARVGQAAVKSCGKPPALGPIAQSPGVFPAPLDAAFTVATTLCHCRYSVA
jgi:hypothetical protein